MQIKLEETFWGPSLLDKTKSHFDSEVKFLLDHPEYFCRLTEVYVGVYEDSYFTRSNGRTEKRSYSMKVYLQHRPLCLSGNLNRRYKNQYANVEYYLLEHLWIKPVVLEMRPTLTLPRPAKFLSSELQDVMQRHLELTSKTE